MSNLGEKMNSSRAPPIVCKKSTKMTANGQHGIDMDTKTIKSISIVQWDNSSEVIIQRYLPPNIFILLTIYIYNASKGSRNLQCENTRDRIHVNLDATIQNRHVKKLFLHIYVKTEQIIWKTKQQFSDEIYLF